MSDYAELLPKKKTRKWIIGILIVFVLALLIVPRLAGRILKTKLQWMVASHLNATLEMGTLDYIPPYRLVGHDLALIVKDAKGNDVRLAEIKKVDLLLAKLPTGSGPLVIQRLELLAPAVHLIHEDDQFAGTKDLAKPSAKPAEEEKPKPKLSEMFRLRHFTLKNGAITYQDRGNGNADAPTMTWKNLNVDMDTNPTSTSEYTYKFAARNAPLAEIDANGRFDIDQLTVEIEKLALAARADAAGHENPLPPQLQEVLKTYRVGGEIRIDGSGRIAAKEAANSTFHAVISMKEARAFAPKVNIALDRLNTRIDVGRDSASSPMVAKILEFDALGRELRLILESGGVSYEPGAGRWELTKLNGYVDMDAAMRAQLAQRDQTTQPANKLQKLKLAGRVDFTAAGSGVFAEGSKRSDLLKGYEVLAYARNVSLVPPTFEYAIEQISGGPVRLASEVVTVENLTAMYGKDQLLLSSARVPLKEIEQAIQVNEIAATATFDRSSSPYPKALGELMKQIRPAGQFVVGGSINMGRKGTYPRTLYNLNITGDGVGAIVNDPAIELTAMQLDVQVERNQVRLRKLTADALGGKLTASGEVKTSEEMRYVGTASVKDLDMEQVSVAFPRQGGESRNWKGRGSAKADFEGEGKGVDGLRAKGEAEILDGDFWDVPLFKGITGHVKVTRDALKVGQAAATYDIEKRQVVLKNLAVSSPALGIQGGGKIDFDGNMDLRLIAAPLADWRDKMKSTGIPVVSAVVGEIVGGIQKVVNSATSNLLYEFKVTGNGGNPKVEPVPVPILTNNAAYLFASMLKQKPDERLLDKVKEKPPEPAKK